MESPGAGKTFLLHAWLRVAMVRNGFGGYSFGVWGYATEPVMNRTLNLF